MLAELLVLLLLVPVVLVLIVLPLLLPTCRPTAETTPSNGATSVEHQARLRILLDCALHPLGLFFRHAGHRQAVREHFRTLAVVSRDDSHASYLTWDEA